MSGAGLQAWLYPGRVRFRPLERMCASRVSRCPPASALFPRSMRVANATPSLGATCLCPGLMHCCPTGCLCP
uniref:RIKEN cDNA 1700018B08 gene n=1 Tax=Mus musculus TaxID=10090 RepID=S4R1A2_MOUSE